MKCRPALLASLVCLPLLAAAPARADDPPRAPATVPPPVLPPPPRPLGAPVTPTTENARTLAVAVRAAIEDAEEDLGRMPFFVRPMARSGFSKRTGHSFDEWKSILGAILKNDTPATLRARWPQADSVLARLVDNFKTAPERARRGMGGNPELLKIVEDKSRARAAAAQAMLDWMRR